MQPGLDNEWGVHDVWWGSHFRSASVEPWGPSPGQWDSWVIRDRNLVVPCRNHGWGRKGLNWDLNVLSHTLLTHPQTHTLSSPDTPATQHSPLRPSSLAEDNAEAINRALGGLVTRRLFNSAT